LQDSSVAAVIVAAVVKVIRNIGFLLVGGRDIATAVKFLSAVIALTVRERTPVHSKTVGNRS
jgi:hypothetical protein